MTTWKTLVRLESGSNDAAGLNRVADYFSGLLTEAGCTVRHVGETAAGVQHIVADRAGATDAPTLLIGHSDTVWPTGTLAKWPFRAERDRAYGPGVADMKGGLAVMAEALIITRDVDERPSVRVIITADEELGSPTGRTVLEASAQGAAYALVFESGKPGGRLIDGRRGSAVFTMRVEGRSAHVAHEPERGINAVDELAHQLLALAALRDPAAGTSVMAGVISGGTARQVVPDNAHALIDVRATEPALLDRVMEAIRELADRPHVPGAKVRIEGGRTRPVMKADATAQPLREVVQSAGRHLTQSVSFVSVGGGSDANLTAAMGIPTIDGFGPVGHHICSYDEYAEVGSAVTRTALLTAVLDEIARR